MLFISSLYIKLSWVCNDTYLKEYASGQSRIQWLKVSYSGYQITVTDVSYSGWRQVTLIFKYLTPARVTGRQSLYETQILYTSHGYGIHISHCTRFQPLYDDFEHYIRDWSLAYSFICWFFPILNKSHSTTKE